MTALTITGLRKAYGPHTALENLDLTVEDGELLAILGASGSGKTTLLRAIAGFERIDAGEIRVGGTLVAGPGVNLRPERRGIGYVAQEGALFPHLSVAANITFGLARPRRRAQDRVAELLALVDLPAHYANRAPQQLSGGEQQRVALARALAPAPALLLLDEPFSALDATLRQETRAAVARAIAAAGAAAILVTHDQEEALSLGQRVGLLQHGRLAQLSRPQELYHRPASPEIARFIGDAVLLDGIASGGTVSSALGALRLATPANGPVRVLIRPEQIQLAASGTEARIADVVFLGHDALVTLAVPGLATPVLARLFSHDLPQGHSVKLQVTGPVLAYPG